MHVLRVETYFKEDYQWQINFVQTLVCYSVKHLLSKNYFFHSQKKVEPVVHPTLYKR